MKHAYCFVYLFLAFSVVAQDFTENEQLKREIELLKLEVTRAQLKFEELKHNKEESHYYLTKDYEEFKKSIIQQHIDLLNDVEKLKVSISKSNEHAISDIEKLKKNIEANYNHTVNDIGKYQSNTKLHFETYIQKLKSESYFELLYWIIFTGVAMLAGSAFALWKSMKGSIEKYVKEYVEEHSLKATKAHAQQLYLKQTELLATSSGHFMFHWWKHYGNKQDSSFDNTISQVSELTVDTVMSIESVGDTALRMLRFVTNSLYYLADTNNQELIKERQKLAMRICDYVEQKLEQIYEEGSNTKDLIWAEIVESYCYGLYKFRISTNEKIKEKLNNAFAHYNPEIVLDIKKSYKAEGYDELF